MLIKHYVQQGIIEFYKIIGSSDLIGNPVGLVDKLGTGFIEFFNEPRKGFLQGPKKFGEGVAKGLNSLVSNVVGGGLESVSKITGTLYGAAKNLQGEKVRHLEEDEPTNIVSGAYEGVTGGVKEIAKGVIGIFTNPYKKAKQEGVTGFFKGLGTGLVGAVISPFSAVLKVGNSLIVGLKNTATFFSRSKLKTDRFRHPRHIDPNTALSSYDSDTAVVQAILRKIKVPSDQKLYFFSDFKYLEYGFEDEITTIIITDKRILIVLSAEEKLFDFDINIIRNSEVHLVGSNKYLIIFYFINGEKKYFVSDNMNAFVQAHGVLQRMLKF
jgi:vacuolar protein sorting-associated protein 13A/C